MTGHKDLLPFLETADMASREQLVKLCKATAFSLSEAIARAEKAEAALREAIAIGDAVFNRIGDGLGTDSLEAEWDEKSSSWADIAGDKP